MGRDRFTFALKGMNELTEVGIGATLSVIFNAPLFGYLAPNENEGEQINEFSKGKSNCILSYYFRWFFRLFIT